MAKKPRIGKVKFLANKARVEKDVLEGWSLYHIHTKYSDDLDMSYPQFVRYVHRYITLKPTPENHNSSLLTSSELKTKEALTKKEKIFEYDPTYSARNKDDLI